MQQNKDYYDEKYFEAQKQVGLDNVKTIKHFFEPHINKDDHVLEFGCGGGFLLSSINCSRRVGFDINPTALATAKKLGVETFDSLEFIEDNSFDVVISNSALEHTPTPYEDLVKLRSKLKENGKVVIRVPHETLGWSYKPNDWNYHLYTWSPMAIGNLLNESGFDVHNVVVEKSKQPPLFNFIKRSRFLLKISGKIYRIFRIIIEELGINTIGIDGNSVVIASKRDN